MRPYDEATLRPYEWLMANVPAQQVDPQTLIPTQPLLVIDRLLALTNGEPAEGPDPCVHVVEVDGRMYLHNGHHRWAVSLLRGDRVLRVRAQSAKESLSTYPQQGTVRDR